MKRNDSTGMPANTQCVGTGEPTLIFVHGVACDHHDWKAQADALSARFRVVTFDLPGHGDTAPPETASVESLAKAVCAIKARYRGGKVVLIGHSLGCRLILEAFRQSPDDIAGLVLVDGSRMAQGDPVASVQALTGMIGTGDARDFMRAAFKEMSALNNDPLLGEDAIARVGLLDQTFARDLMLSVARWDAGEIETVLASVDVPLLVLQSTHIDDTYQWHRMEPGMTNTWIDLVTGLTPHTEVRVVPGVGHFIQIEAASILNETVGSFASLL